VGIDHYYWFYSTIAQSLAALIGVTLVIAVFRFQIVYTNLERKKRDAVDLSLDANKPANRILPMEEIYKEAKENIKNLENYRSCLKGRVMFLVTYLSVLFLASMVCVNFSSYFQYNLGLSEYILNNVFVILFFGIYLFIRFCWYCVNFAVIEVEH